MAKMLQIEVVYAEPEQQILLQLSLFEGATVADAIKISGIEREIGAVAPDRVGVFGKRVDRNMLLRQGDRIEIYRPLKIDPKESRRQRARRKF